MKTRHLAVRALLLLPILTLSLPLAFAAAPAKTKTKSRLTASQSSALYGEPITLTAAVSPLGSGDFVPVGSVLFEDVTTGTALGTVALGADRSAVLIVSSLAPGRHTVRASFTSPSGTGASDDSTNLRIDVANSTTTVSSSGTPSPYGQPVTFTATVTPATGSTIPTGSVVFTIDGASFPPVTLNATGQATTSVSLLSVGSHVVVASYTSNNGTHNPSASAAFTQVVQPAATTIQLASSPNPSAPGQTVTFVAAVSAGTAAPVPTGSVTFTVDGVTLATVSLDALGQAAATVGALASGDHAVSAAYTSNSANFGSSGPVSLTQVVQVSRRDILVTGSDSGVARVDVYDPTTLALVFSLLPYGSSSGPVTVAAGDVNGDGSADIITCVNNTAASHVKVFSGVDASTIHSFLVFEGVAGQVSVAAGDINGDGRADIILGAPTAGHIKVYDGTTTELLRSFFAFGGSPVGVTVAAGDVNGDGRADIIAGSSVFGQLQVFDSVTQLQILNTFAYGFFYNGGINVAAADVNRDGRADIITGTNSEATHVKVFDGGTFSERASFFAYPGLTTGVRVAAGDVNGDGRADIITAPVGVSPHVQAFDGITLELYQSFFAGSPAADAGVYIGASR